MTLSVRALAMRLAVASLPFLAGPALAHEVRLKLDERQIRAAGIETQAVTQEPAISELIVPGTVAVPPQQTRIVATPAAGLIEAFLVAPDEDVTKGDPIAQLNSSGLIEAQRAFLEAEGQDALAREKLRRDEQLFKERIIAERRLLVTRSEAVLARSNFDERSQLLALHGMNEAEIDTLRKTRRIASTLVIRAPESGTILSRNVTAGERVQAAAPLVTIARLDPIWVNLQVPVARAPMLASIKRVSLPAYGVAGRIVRVGRTVDAATQSVVAVAEFSTKEHSLRPGQAVQATIVTNGSTAPQWRVPSAAVVRHDGRDWMFLREPDGFRAISVQVVAETSTTTSIRADIKPDAVVAARGVLVLLSELASATH